MKMRAVLAILATWMLAAHAHAERPCSRPAIVSAASSLHDARTALIAVPVGDMDTDVPPPARRAIERFKDRLQAYVETSLACMPAAASDAAILAALRAHGDRGERGPKTDGHGRDLDYAVLPVPNHADWIAVVPSFGIQCGSDAIALFYRRQGAHWREAMVRRSAPYKEVNGGWENLHIDAPRAGPDGRWYVALTHGTPWCTSIWSGYHVELVRPTADPLRPDIFLRRHLGYNRGFDTMVTAAPRWFEVRLVDFSHDDNIWVRTSVQRWAIEGDHTRRIPPVALNAQDFVDEWIMTPWREASAWSAPGLAAWHRKLGFADADKTEIDTWFDQIRACPGNRTEVALGSENGQEYYLMVRRRGLAFRLLGLSRRHDLRCAGPNLKHDKPLLRGL